MGDGTFAEAIDLVAPDNPGPFAIGDFDGNGTDDAAVVSLDDPLVALMRLECLK